MERKMGESGINRISMIVLVLLFVSGINILICHNCSSDENEASNKKEAANGAEEIKSTIPARPSRQAVFDQKGQVKDDSRDKLTEEGHGFGILTATDADSKEWAELDETERFNKLKDLITENLPYIEKQLQDAFKSPVKLKLSVESRSEEPISTEELIAKFTNVEINPGEIQEKSADKEK
jgi:hypothetical protein